jgi:hypothetical protein
VQVAEQQFICASTVLEVISSLSNAARIGINLLLDACEAAGSDVLTAMRHLSNVTTMIPRELASQSGDEQLHSHSSLISSLAAANDCFAAVLPLALDRMAEESQASDLLNRWWQCARRVTSCMRLCSTSASQPLQKVLGYAERAYCLRKDRVLIEDCDARVSVAHAEQQPTSAVASIPGTSLRLSETLIRRDDTPPVSECPRTHLHDGLAQLHTAESAEWASSFVHAMNELSHILRYCNWQLHACEAAMNNMNALLMPVTNTVARAHSAWPAQGSLLGLCSCFDALLRYCDAAESLQEKLNGYERFTANDGANGHDEPRFRLNLLGK